MGTAGIIAEYNPFHNGHAHHIARCRQAGATHIVVVMSGNFVQRGEPAFLEKRVRTKQALSCGADLILELPLPYAMAPAERFAFGGVSVLDALGCVDRLAFGSECGDARLLRAAADSTEGPAFQSELARLLSTGMTFARARQAAAQLTAGDAAAVLGKPNDSLAVEYLRSLKAANSKMTPLVIRREGAAHDSTQQEGGICSASQIRQLVRLRGAPAAREWMPPESFRLMEDALRAGTAPHRPERLELAVLSRLRLLRRSELTSLPDLSEGLENRLYDAIRASVSLEGLHMAVKTKRYTLARVRRLVLSAALSVDAQLCRESPPYVRVLGFNTRGRELLSTMKTTCALPVSGSLARLREVSSLAARMAELEALATDFYTLLTATSLPCGFDYTATTIRTGE